MLRRFALVRTDVSEEHSASIIRVTRTGELGTTLKVISNRHTLLVTANLVSILPILVTLMMEAIRSSESQFLQEPHGVKIPEHGINIPEHGINHNHRRENLKSYIP
jgi:hypothetical protein